jgi:hypothetical protein
MYSIYPSSAGSLLEWDVRNGDYVDEGEVLGRTQSLPYITIPVKGTVVQDNVEQNQTVPPPPSWPSSPIPTTCTSG